MRAAVCHRYGSPEVVRVEDMAPPVLGPGRIRVRVACAALNFPDVLLVADRYQVTVPPPFVPGSEYAGVVAEVAGDVAGDPSAPAVGDRVFGAAIVGALAEEIVVPARSVTPVPDGLDDETAAAFGVAHRTAYHVLRSVARLQTGERLVVLGAGGGVGLAAVQLGSVLGGEVVAVASTDEKLRVAAAEGAAHLVNHRAAPLRESLRALAPEGVDVVVDPVGGGLAEPALRAVRFGGRFVTVGYASGEIPRIPLNLVLLKGAQILGFQMLTFAANAPAELERDERELMALLASGRVRPHIGASFPLAEAADALGWLAAGRAVGKVVVRITDDAR